jgi:hypothetical protein
VFPVISEVFRIVPKLFCIVSGEFHIVPRVFPIVPRVFPVISEAFHIVPKLFRIVSGVFHIVPGAFPIVPRVFPVISEVFRIVSGTFRVVPAVLLRVFLLARMLRGAAGARLHRVPFLEVVCSDSCVARILVFARVCNACELGAYFHFRRYVFERRKAYLRFVSPFFDGSLCLFVLCDKNLAAQTGLSFCKRRNLSHPDLLYINLS